MLRVIRGRLAWRLMLAWASCVRSLAAHEKTSTVSSAVIVVAASGASSLVSYPSVVRFIGHLQLKGLAPRTVEAYVCMIRLLAQWAAGDPAALSEEQVRDYFLHLVNARSYAPKTMRQARAALSCFFLEMLARTDWRVFAHVKTRDTQQLPELQFLLLGCAGLGIHQAFDAGQGLGIFFLGLDDFRFHGLNGGGVDLVVVSVGAVD